MRSQDEFSSEAISRQNGTSPIVRLSTIQVGDAFHSIPFEGILGLAFPSMSANGVVPFFDNVIDQRVLAKNEFAFYFNMDEAAKSNQATGNNAIFWGGVDLAFYEKVVVIWICGHDLVLKVSDFRRVVHQRGKKKCQFLLPPSSTGR